MKFDEMMFSSIFIKFHQVSSNFIKFHFFGFFSPDFFPVTIFFKSSEYILPQGFYSSIGTGCLLSRQPSLYLPTKQNQTPMSQVLVTKDYSLDQFFFWRLLPTKFAPMLWEALGFLRYSYPPLPFAKAGPTKKNTSTAVVSHQSFFSTPTAFH